MVSVVGDRLDGLDGVRVSKLDDDSNTVVEVALSGGGTTRRWSIVCYMYSGYLYTVSP